jgi:hypothetical protein
MEQLSSEKTARRTVLGCLGITFLGVSSLLVLGIGYLASIPFPFRTHTRTGISQRDDV